MRKDITLERKILNYLIVVAAILWTGFIFSNSLQTASDSLEQSGIFVKFFINLVRVIFKDSIPVELSKYIDLYLVEHIRSLAHVIEFFVLYLLAEMAFKVFHKIKKIFTHAFLYGLIVMAIDETIQIFIDGRGFQLKDLALDTLGMLLALLIIGIVKYFRTKKRKGKKDSHNS